MKHALIEKNILVEYTISALGWELLPIRITPRARPLGLPLVFVDDTATLDHARENWTVLGRSWQKCVASEGAYLKQSTLYFYVK